MKFPHPLALLTGCIALAAALTWVLPAGQFDRRHDDVTGREIVVAGTFHHVDARPVSPFGALVAIPKGMAEAGSVIFLVLLVGGAFVVVDKTGALRQVTGALAWRLRDRAILVIPVVALFFALGGVLENMAEEIIALVPVLLLLGGQLGFDAIVMVATSMGTAAVGAAFSPLNPFQVGIAQKLAQVPLLSGWQFRMVFLALALTIWIGATMRLAARTRVTPAVAPAGATEPLGAHGALVLATVLTTFVVFIYGVMRLGWDFDQMSALFFLMGVTAGLVGGLGITGTCKAFAEGFASMAYAAALIGFARAIFVVLDQGHIIDTIVNGIFAPLDRLPVGVSALGMMTAQFGIHFPVPSVSGQAVLTMPVLVPLSDLIGLQRQTTVLSYQYGAGLGDLVTPTNGALMAILAAAGVGYGKWLKFAVPWTLVLLGLGAGGVLLAIALGLR